uniref:Movement protein n=1 Tax=Prunevirus armeniacae TaxID=1343920 RepID=A0A7M3T1M9_9VIRU|nr:movement protein [Apricot vein clearing associated virus]
MALINVQSLCEKLSLDESILGSSEINKLYPKDHHEFIFKDEVKLMIGGNLDGSLISLQAPILTSERLSQIKTSKPKSAYLHLGFVPIVLQSLLPSGNDLIRGTCALIDTSRCSLSTGLIDIFRFKFTSKNPRAGKLLTINAPIDINDEVSVGSVQLLLQVEGVDLREKRSVMSITVGMSCVPTTNASLLHKLSGERPSWNLLNVESLSSDDKESEQAFQDLFLNCKTGVVETGKIEYLKGGRKLPFFGKRFQPVFRRDIKTTGLLEIPTESRSLSRSLSQRSISSEYNSGLFEKPRFSLERNFKDVFEKSEKRCLFPGYLHNDLGSIYRSNRPMGLEDHCGRSGKEFNCRSSKEEGCNPKSSSETNCWECRRDWGQRELPMAQRGHTCTGIFPPSRASELRSPDQLEGLGECTDASHKEPPEHELEANNYEGGNEILSRSGFGLLLGGPNSSGSSCRKNA